MNRASARAAAEALQLLYAPRTKVMFHGKSMEPILREGDNVVLEPVAFEDVEVGQIITYRYESKYPTRRVVARRSDHLVLWCDSWPSLRFHVHAADILGRVVARIRDGEQLDCTDDDWKAQTQQALRVYRRSHGSHLLRRLRRAIAQRVLGREIPPLPG